MVSPLFNSQILGSILLPCSQLNLNLMNVKKTQNVLQQIHFARWALDTVDVYSIHGF